jgi:hypothetical protein
MGSEETLLDAPAATKVDGPTDSVVQDGPVRTHACASPLSHCPSHGSDAWRRSVMLFGQADLFESLQLRVRELRAAGERLSVKHGLLGPADILDLWGP